VYTSKSDKTNTSLKLDLDLLFYPMIRVVYWHSRWWL